MSVPDIQSLMLPALKALSSGAEMTVSEVCTHVATSEGLTPEEVWEKFPSGRESVFENRTGWAVREMTHTGLIERARRGVYRLALEGKKLLDQAPSRIDYELLRGYTAYVEQQLRKNTLSVSSDSAKPVLSEDASITPEEALDRYTQKIRDELEDMVLDRVRDAPSSFLERVIVDLLISMGYGGGDTAMGQVTGRPGDGGIDGTIREDALGLDEVYLQAKKYAADNTVGESDLRNFAGALDAKGTTKGVFVTTAGFTRGAIEYVARSPKRIVLIDGKNLAHLMVKNNIGVRRKTQYEVKKIDEDYFNVEAI